MRYVEEVQVALIERLKADTDLITLLGTADQIKEPEWQGAEFDYPSVRVANTIRPNNAYCAPDDVDITIYALSEKKSSKQCTQVMDEICKYLHNQPFTGTNGVRFVFVRVDEAPYPIQQEGQSVWISPIKISSQVS